MQDHQMCNLRFDQKFTEQLGYLQRSSKLFDDGHEDEAIRLATSLRVLLHDKRKNVSLFTHTGRRNGELLSSARGIGDWQDYLAHEINPLAAEPIRMKPIMGTNFNELPIEEWWSSETVFAHDGVQYSRKLIVLSAADKDGGAHVDKDLEDYYKVLRAGEYAIGISRDFDPPRSNHLPVERPSRVAEAVCSRDDHFSHPFQVE